MRVLLEAARVTERPAGAPTLVLVLAVVLVAAVVGVLALGGFVLFRRLHRPAPPVQGMIGPVVPVRAVTNPEGLDAVEFDDEDDTYDDGEEFPDEDEGTPPDGGPSAHPETTVGERPQQPAAGPSPAPSAPAPVVPAPSVPAPVVPAPSVPAPVVPAPSVPAPVVPAPSVPAPVPSAPGVPPGQLGPIRRALDVLPGRERSGPLSRRREAETARPAPPRVSRPSRFFEESVDEEFWEGEPGPHAHAPAVPGRPASRPAVPVPPVSAGSTPGAPAVPAPTVPGLAAPAPVTPVPVVPAPSVPVPAVPVPPPSVSAPAPPSAAPTPVAPASLLPAPVTPETAVPAQLPVPAARVPVPSWPAPVVPMPAVPAPAAPVPVVPAPVVPAAPVPAAPVPAAPVPVPSSPAPVVPMPAAPVPVAPAPTLPVARPVTMWPPAEIPSGEDSPADEVTAPDQPTGAGEDGSGVPSPAQRRRLRNASRRLARATDRTAIARATTEEAAALIAADTAALVIRSIEGPRVLWQQPDGADPARTWGPATLAALLALGSPVREVLDGDPLADGAATALLVVPVAAEGTPVGAIVARRSTCTAFAAADEDALARLARMSGSALDAAARRGRSAAVPGADLVTGFATRDGLTADLQSALRSAQQHGMPMSLVLLEITGLSQLRREQGRPAADQVLAGICEVLARRLRVGDVGYRFGHDELAFLLPLTGPSGARAVAERLTALPLALDVPLPGGARGTAGGPAGAKATGTPAARAAGRGARPA
ncbi:MAG TPA: GGDEF domain-containing protein, partial [Kineosporiaceae bacterium]|nr:GGDEF domain-containing protein [Kineosporiaceae bacterium]